jgi:cytochrome c oxidase subunit 2
LVFIGVPSLIILYSTEMLTFPDLTLKITGHQWYWSYDYSDLSDVEFDSYLVPCHELSRGTPRLLETDNHVLLPLASDIRFIVSSRDVLHSWALPSFGLKADANPGRLNVAYLSSTNICGIIYGQCSEICGANHSFIPISVEILPFSNFYTWVKAF